MAKMILDFEIPPQLMKKNTAFCPYIPIFDVFQPPLLSHKEIGSYDLDHKTNKKVDFHHNLTMLET